MVDIIPTFTKPIKELVRPVCKDLIAPFYNISKDIYAPIYQLWTHKTMSKTEALESWKKLTQCIARIIIAVGVFFIYQVAWKAGVHYLGLLGGLASFSLIYIAGNYIDCKSNYVGNSAWFLYKGTIGILKSFGDSTGSMLCLLLIRDRQFKTEEDKGLFNHPLMKSVIDSIAIFVHELTYSPPSSPTTEPKKDP